MEVSSSDPCGSMDSGFVSFPSSSNNNFEQSASLAVSNTPNDHDNDHHGNDNINDNGKGKMFPLQDGTSTEHLYVSTHKGCRSRTASPAPSVKTSPKSRRKQHGKYDGSSLPLEEMRMASIQGNLTVVKQLHKKGLSVDQILKSDWTALMYSSSSGRSSVVRYLLMEGADPNIHKELFTALMAACASSHTSDDDLLQCVSHLLDHGAKVNVAERHRVTPLMFASKEGRLSIVKQLVKANAYIDKQDNKGWTSLCWAAARGHGKIVRFLLQHEADPTIDNSFGQTPADVALASGYPEIADILERVSNSPDSTKAEDAISRLPDKEIKKLRSDDCTVAYGELQMILTGLDLQYLIPLFDQHKMTMELFLRLNENDLNSMGVTAIGVRKKILSAIKDIHRKEWKTSSLPNLSKLEYITVPEAASMMANMAKHIQYIDASVGYMRLQLQSSPRLLQMGQEKHSVTTLKEQCKQTLGYLHSLHQEVRFFTAYLEKVCDDVEFASADLIVECKNDGHRWKRRIFTYLFSATCLATLVWYTRPRLFAFLFDKKSYTHTVFLDL